MRQMWVWSSGTKDKNRERMGVERIAFASFLVVLLAYLASRKQPSTTSDLDSVLQGLLREENFRSVNGNNRVAVGFGSCVDYFSSAVELVEALDLQPPDSPRHHDVISSTRDLAEALAFHFRHGGAAERYCSDENLFGRWATVAKSMDSTLVQIGGNAPVIARRFAMEGWQVLLGSRMDPHTTHKLHPLITVADNSSDTSREDIHLLFEFDLGDVWGPYTAPRANRFIVHNDYSNMMLESLDSFMQSLTDFQPALVVVSGLQMLDNFPLDTEIRTSKLRQLQQALSVLPPSVKVHFEMASITEEKLLNQLLEYVIPYSDSLGMNEQELANLCSMFEFGNVTIASDPYPRVAKALDQIRSLHSLLEARKSPSQHHRELSRVHVHTLAYQAILVTRDSVWRNMNGAVAKASLTAHRYICASNKISVENAKLIMDDSFSVSTEPGSHRMPLVDSAPVSCWSEERVRFCVAPNLVCTAVRQTGGGGDNVSAAGLVLQL